MSQQANTPEPATDLFQNGQENLKNSPDASPRAEIANKKMMGIAVATALLGGATFAATRVIDGKPVVTDGTPPPVEPRPADGETHVSHGTITPNEHITVAHSVNDRMTFEEAYAAAREEVGPEGIFTWNNRVYNTFTQEEWGSLSLADRQEFLTNVGYKPTQPEVQNDDSQAPPKTPEQQGDEIPTPPETPDQQDSTTPEPPRDLSVPEPVYVETVIEGNPAVGFDDDGDGIADGLVIIDTDGNIGYAFLEGESQEGFETIIRFDLTTEEILETAPLDHPYVYTMDQLDELNTETPEVNGGNTPGDDDDTSDDDATSDEVDADEEEGVDTSIEGETATNGEDDGYDNQANVNDMA